DRTECASAPGRSHGSSRAARWRAATDTPALAWPSLNHSQGWLLGLPFVLAAFGPCLVLGGQVCLAVLTIATLATFLVYVPLTALALNGSNAWSRMRLCRRSRREPMPRCWCYGLRQHGSAHMPRRIC